MNATLKTVLIWIIAIFAIWFLLFRKKRRIKHRRHSPAARSRKRSVSRGAKKYIRATRRASGTKRRKGKLIRLGNRMLTPKQWGEAMQRRRKRAA
jgi:hypothetical protein